MYGQQILNLYTQIHELGLTDSMKSFSLRWCGRGEDLLRDYARRDGARARVSPSTVRRLRARLAEAARLLPADLARQVRAIEAQIERDVYVYDLLGRLSVRA